MARSLQEIKTELEAGWMRNETLQAAYGFNADAKFLEVFSRVSLENVILFIVACALWVHECMFDKHYQEVVDYIKTMKPHTLRWYVRKAKEYQIGCPLIEGTDQYNNTGLTDEEIDRLQVVKFAAASESGATVYVKVATDNGGVKAPIQPDEEEGLKAYFAEVKDAGVRVEIINQPGSRIRLGFDVYYDPMVFNSEGHKLDDGSEPVREVIKDFISNLPFNGEFRNSALVDALQAIPGVVIPELKLAEDSFDGVVFNPINAKSIPSAGYYRYEEEQIKINYIPYEVISD